MSTISRGQDLLEDSLAFGPRRKIILDSYYPNAGIDVMGVHEYTVPQMDDEEQQQRSETLLMNGSILAFPHSCYLWKPKTPKEVTLDSLSMVLLMDPPIDLLLIGADDPLPLDELMRIKEALRKKHVVVEQMNVMNAMGSFNILNGEDRNVAVAILLNVNNEE